MMIYINILHFSIYLLLFGFIFYKINMISIEIIISYIRKIEVIHIYTYKV